MNTSPLKAGRPPDVSDEEARRYFRQKYGDRLPGLLQQISARDLVPEIAPYAKKGSDYLAVGDGRMISAFRVKQLLENDGVGLPPPKETSKIIHIHPQPATLVDDVRYQQVLGWLLHDATAAFAKVGNPLPSLTTPATPQVPPKKYRSDWALIWAWFTPPRAIALSAAFVAIVLTAAVILIARRTAPPAKGLIETLIVRATRERIESPFIAPYDRWPNRERITAWQGNLLTFANQLGVPIGLSEIKDVYLSTGHDLRRLLVLSTQNTTTAEDIFDGLRQSSQVTTSQAGQLISTDLGVSVTKLESILVFEELSSRPQSTSAKPPSP